jgi:small neutral amino acid transporter SnatA (MarC family)
MKDFGWHMFCALLLADIIGLVMLKLNVGLKITLIVGGIVFVIIAVVMFIGKTSHQRMKKREAEAAAKIADLQDQVDGALKN